MVDSWRAERRRNTTLWIMHCLATFFPSWWDRSCCCEILPQFEDKKNWKLQWDNLAPWSLYVAAGLVKGGYRRYFEQGGYLGVWTSRQILLGRSNYHNVLPIRFRFILISVDIVIWQQDSDICSIFIFR